MVSKHLVLSTTMENMRIGYDALCLNFERLEHKIGLVCLPYFDG
jgi:hypothetical protein